MKDYWTTAPQGRVVLFRAQTWTDHARKHHDELGHDFEVVATTLSEPDKILQNTQMHGRTATELFVRYDGAIGGHVIVPVKPLAQNYTITNQVTLLSGANGALLGTTVYVTAQVPPVRVLYDKGNKR